MEEIANLKAPIICIFVRVMSGLAALFFKLVTTSTVALANKSSDKLEERDAEEMKKNLLKQTTILRSCFQQQYSQPNLKLSISGFKISCLASSISMRSGI